MLVPQKSKFRNTRVELTPFYLQFINILLNTKQKYNLLS